MSFPSRAMAAATLLALAAAPTPATLQAQGQRVRVAVLGFENNSSWGYWGDQLGEAAADEMITQLVNSGRFSVIERRQLDAIIAEQNLGQSGRINPATASQIGEVLGVQVVLMGSITQFSIERKSGGIGRLSASFSEAEAIMDVRVVNTSTAEIMSVAEGNGKKRFGGVQFRDMNFQQNFDAGLAQEALRPAVEDIVEELVDRITDLAALAPVVAAGSVVGVNDGSVYIDRGQNFGVEVGQRFDVHRVVDIIRDADSFQAVPRLTVALEGTKGGQDWSRTFHIYPANGPARIERSEPTA